ncbi:hypothetical protein ACFL59_12890 [Planctomycetota bacterium]
MDHPDGDSGGSDTTRIVQNNHFETTTIDNQPEALTAYILAQAGKRFARFHHAITGSALLINPLYEVGPFLCHCGAERGIVSVIEHHDAVESILRHLGM